MSIFPKGITHDFPNKFIMFKYVLNKKNFLNYKNVILTYSEHDHFSKGGNPGFSSKIWKFFWVLFSFKNTSTWCLIMFQMEKRLSELQKWYFNIVEQCPFFLRGELVICLKNLKFLTSLIFFEKYLDMIINNVLNVKKGLSRLQECSVTTSNDFPQKFIISFKSHFVWKIPRHDVQ